MLYIPHFSTLPLQPPKMIPFSSLLAALRHQKLGNGPIVTVIFLLFLFFFIAPYNSESINLNISIDLILPSLSLADR